MVRAAPAPKEPTAIVAIDHSMTPFLPSRVQLVSISASDPNLENAEDGSSPKTRDAFLARGSKCAAHTPGKT